MEVISQGERRPDVSILFPAWRVERFVAEAARSVLEQRGVVAEILFSDDASPDRTFEILRQSVCDYRGPHRVVLRRNSRNLGIDHIAELVDLAACDVMMAAHGDDVSEPERAVRILAEMNRCGAFVCSSNLNNIDESGRSLGLQNPVGGSAMIAAEEIARQGWMHTMFGSTLAWRREVYTAFPRLDSAALPIGHDHVLPFRGAVLGGLRYIGEPLVRYRRHEGQWKNRLHGHRSAAVRRESTLANAMSSRLCMLRDVRHRLQRAQARDAEELGRLQTILEAAVSELAAEWVAVRDDLYRDGWRPDWVPRSEHERELLAWLRDPRRIARAGRLLSRSLWRAYGIASDLLRGRVSRRPTY